MKRKETLGRLLLTLLTAFVMVAGAFVTASSSFMDEGTPSGPVAVRELEEENGVDGEAPYSAIMDMETEKQSISLTDTAVEESPDQPQALQAWEIEVPEEDQEGVSRDVSYLKEEAGEQNDLEPMVAAPIGEPGTRSATVDAGGPYGDRDNPIYEGNPIYFEANIAGDINDNYKFRWDVNDDDEYDGPGSAPDYWGAYGDNDLNHMFMDNHIGEAKVEAWDGVSTVPVTGGGNVFGNGYYNGYWSIYPYTYGTYGYRFTASKDITVTEMGWFRAYYPYQVYYLDIWEYPSQTWIGGSGYISGAQNYYTWNWRTLSSPISLTAGEYVVTSYHRTYTYGYFPYLYDPTPTDDGVIDITQGFQYRSGYGYPTSSISTTNVPAVDFEYEYTYQVPDLLEDTADVFVDNVAPIVINPMSTVSVGQEGSEVGFTGWFMDPGFDDEWQYRWDWGDGTQSSWLPINKWSGGAKVLLYHSVAGYETEVLNTLSGLLGENAPVFDMWSYYDDPGTLEMLLEYDVLIVPENTGIIGGWPDDVGDLLADYVDAGGNVVDTVATFMSPGTTWGFTGRWADEGYSCMVPTTSFGGAKSTTALYPANDPGPAGMGILDGVAGTISSFGTTIPINCLSIRPEATILADYGAYKAAAFKDTGAMGPGSGRIVTINIFPLSGYRTGDAMEIIANAAFWASGQSPPALLPMPIQLPETFHRYKDDHPDTLTPEDEFDVYLEVKDDDHGKIFGGAGADWGTNLAQAPAAVATHSGGGSGVWGPDRLNNGDKIGTYNDCWTAYGGGTNWNQLVWPSPVTIGGTSSYYTRYRTLQGYCMHSCDIEYWTGSSWQFILHYDDLDHGNHFIDAFIAFPAPVSTTRLRMSNMLTYTTNGNIMIQEWEVHPALPGGDPYEMVGLGDGFTTITIENVFPGADNVLGVELDVAENTPILYEGFELTDPAMGQKTEGFYYRWDFDDSTAVTPWTAATVKAPTSLDVLLVEWIDLTYGGANQLPLLEAINECPILARFEQWNMYVENAAPPQDYMNEFDVILYANNYAFGAWWNEVTILGDRLAQFQDDTGGGVITMMGTYGGSNWRLDGRYIDEDYGPFEMGVYAFGSPTLGTVHLPGHPIMDMVDPSKVQSSAVYSGNYALSAGSQLVADWVGGNTAIGVKDKPGNGRSVHIGMAYYYGLNSDDDGRLISNAMIWAGTNFSPLTDTQAHNFMDNGIYYVDLQVIDDDMLWDFTPSGPVFTGTPGTEMDWISHTIFPTSVDNTDPLIAPISAMASLDLSLRVTGTPGNEATMTLFYDGMPMGSVVQEHDGNNQIAVMPVTLDVLNINKYHIEVEYDFEDDGGNPTWIFEGRFSSGHTKELKHVFKEGSQPGNIWTIGADLLKVMLRGEDIVFSAAASDHGSDDLAFVWSWGDTTPQGVHIYANADQSVLDGVTDVDNLIFNQDPDRDPWFDRAPNTVRSPDGGPIAVRDSISHAFDEDQSAFIYVTLTVLDDDVGDGYPSTFLNGGGYDMEYACIDLR